jgi:hypothetical protein
MPMQNSTTVDLATLIERLGHDHPELKFQESNRFSWHAGDNRITYTKVRRQSPANQWALLHEVGHAMLDHSEFSSEFELLKIEVAAWERAIMLAHTYAVAIDEDYIQDCLDTYRDWLHIRSTCPNCYERCLQADKHNYHCHNCGTDWRVTRSRLCRPYRRKTP